MPVVDDTQVGYTTAFVVVSSVIAVFVAFVAVVAVVAVFAFPFKAPTNVVDVTEDKPAIVVAVPPKLIAVEPTVMLELFSALLGMLVKEAPEPLNTVADKTPVDGLNWNFVELTYSVDRLPVVVAANSG